MSLTNLILRNYLMRFIAAVAIFRLCLFDCHINGINGASFTRDNSVQIGKRYELNREDGDRIVQTIKMKLMMLNQRENHTTFDLMQVHSMTVRLTVGLMYESIVQVKLNETQHQCAIELWIMPVLNANKFQMKCDDDKQREYHLIDDRLRQMNANEVSEFGEKFTNVLQQHEFSNCTVILHRIVSAQRMNVNGFIDLAQVTLQHTNSNETIDCAVEAWESSLLFRDLNVACKSNVYKVIFMH